MSNNNPIEARSFFKKEIRKHTEDDLIEDEIAEKLSTKQFGSVRVLEMMKRINNSIHKLHLATVFLSAVIILLTIYLISIEFFQNNLLVKAVFIVIIVIIFSIFLIFIFAKPPYYKISELFNFFRGKRGKNKSQEEI